MSVKDVRSGKGHIFEQDQTSVCRKTSQPGWMKKKQSQVISPKSKPAKVAELQCNCKHAPHELKCCVLKMCHLCSADKDHLFDMAHDWHAGDTSAENWDGPFDNHKGGVTIGIMPSMSSM